MNQHRDNGAENENAEVDLLDILIVLAKHKWFMLLFTLAFAAIPLVYDLTPPRTYYAESRILLSGKQTATVADILKSPAIVDSVIDKTELQTYYAATNRQDTRKRTLANLNVTDDPRTDIVVVAFGDANPQKAEEIANAFVDFLTDSMSQDMNHESVLLRMEEGILNARVALLQSRKQLEKYSEERIPVPHTKDGVSETAARIISKETSNDIEPNKTEPGRYRKKLIKTFRPSLDDVDNAYQLRLIRNAKIDELKYCSMIENYNNYLESISGIRDAASLTQSSNSGFIRILTPAFVSNCSPATRRIVFHVLLGSIIGFICSVFGAFVLEFFSKATQNPKQRRKIEVLRNALKLRPSEK